MKWPNTLTIIRHGESAYNVLNESRKKDVNYKKFADLFNEEYKKANKLDWPSKKLIKLAKQAWKENGFEYYKFGGAVVIEQSNLTPHLFLNEIKRILDNPALAQKMGEGAKNFSQLEAGQKVAEELIELVS